MMEENTAESELYDLCIQYKDCIDRAARNDIITDISEVDAAQLDAAADNIRQWMNLHKHEEARFKAAACYSTINGTGLHIILEDVFVPVDLVDTWMKYVPETALVKDQFEMLPLHCACYEPSLELVQILVNACPESVQIPMYDGMLPLHIACGGRGRTHHVCDLDLEVLNFLIETFPASLDVKTNDNMSVVDILQRWSRRDSGYDTDVSEGEEDDDDSIHTLERNNHGYVASEFLLHAVYDNLSIHLIKLLLQAFPTSAVATGPSGRTLLHFACSTFKGDDIDLIALLLDSSPEAAAMVDRHGKTPVQFFQAAASRRDERGMCLLHRLAAWSKGFSVSFLVFLITAYPDCVELRDKYEIVPYQYAFQNKALSIEVLMHFVQMSPEILCRNRYRNLNDKEEEELSVDKEENGLSSVARRDLVTCNHTLEPIAVEGTQSSGTSKLTAAEREERQQSIKLHIQLLEHASGCNSGTCTSNCQQMKGFLSHERQCQEKSHGTCKICKRIWTLLRIHAQQCKERTCHIPQCNAIRERIRQIQKQQQAMDDRRRQEMNRTYRHGGVPENR